MNVEIGWKEQRGISNDESEESLKKKIAVEGRK